MSVVETNDARRVVESGRFERALTENMTVERVAEQFFEVHSQSGNTYQVDLRTGACTCPDSEKRGDRFVCKHAIRVALVDARLVTGRKDGRWKKYRATNRAITLVTVLDGSVSDE